MSIVIFEVVHAAVELSNVVEVLIGAAVTVFIFSLNLKIK